MDVENEPELRERLARRIRARRDELGLSQDALAARAGIGVNTIIRMEQADFAKKRSKTWAPVEEALGWIVGFFDDYLAGEVDDDLETRYQRSPSTDLVPVHIVRDMLYEAFMAGAPDAPLENYDKARRAAFDFLRRNGINVAVRHEGTSSGSDEGA